MKKARLGPLNIIDIQTGIEKLKEQEAELSKDEFLQLLQLTADTAENEYRNASSVVQQVWDLFSHGKGMYKTVTVLFFVFWFIFEHAVNKATFVNLEVNRDWCVRSEQQTLQEISHVDDYYYR